MKILAVISVVLLVGCASPTIILKQGKTWQVAKDHDGLPCIVKDENGVKQNARCKLNAGDVVVPASAMK